MQTKVTTTTYDDNGREVGNDAFTLDHQDVSADAEIEYVSTVDGGPGMRPKRPRR